MYLTYTCCIYLYIWYHVLSWYSNTLCPFACDAAKSNFPMVRGTTVSRKMRKSSLLLTKMQKNVQFVSIKISWHFAVWWSDIFFSQQPFSEGGHRIYSWRWARIPRIGNWRLKDRRLGGCCWDMKICSTIFFVLDFIRSIIFLKLKSPNPDTNSWLVGYGFAGCFFVLWVFSHPTIYTSS